MAETIDQGTSYEHPIVGQNTGTLDKTIYPLTAPGEALANNGQMVQGALSNMYQRDIGSFSSQVDEDTNVVSVSNSLGSNGGFTLGRYRLREAFDYAPNIVTGVGRLLIKSASRTIQAVDATFSINGITYANSGSAITTIVGGDLICACTARINASPQYDSTGIFYGVARLGNYEVYYQAGGVDTLVATASMTTHDMAPHFNAWLNGGRYIVQMPIFDANGPLYARTTTTPTVAASWAALSYSAWIAGLQKSASTTLSLFGTERTTAGRNQVGANITVSAVGVLTETALVPEVGYTQGANAFNGPGFYSSLFTDTAGGASIQAMTGNVSGNVNTQATGAGITETILPDAVGLIDSGVNTFDIKIKAANKKAAFICIGYAPITEFGGFELSYLPTIIGPSLGGVVYAVAPYNFEFIQGRTSSTGFEEGQTFIDRNVYQRTAWNVTSIVDMNFGARTFNVNYGGFVRSFVVYQGSFSDGLGANTITFQSANKFTNTVALGSYTGVSSSALPNRISLLDYPDDMRVEAYHSAYTNGAKREYINGGYLRFDNTAYLDVPAEAFVQNDNLPIPSGCINSDGLISLPTGLAVQTVVQSSSDGSVYGYAGYTLTNFSPLVGQPFVMQGTSYSFDKTNIYILPRSATGIGSPEVALACQGLVFLVATPTGAYFLREYDNMVLLFDGGRNFTEVVSFQKIVSTSVVGSNYTYAEDYSCNYKAVKAIWNSNVNETVFRLPGLYTQYDVGFIKYRAGMTSYFALSPSAGQTSPAWGLMRRNKNTIYTRSDSVNIASRLTIELATGTIQSLTYQAPYYGLIENQLTRVHKYVMRLKVTDPATTTLTITYKWFTGDADGTETFAFAGAAYTATSDGYTYIEYIPSNQIVCGASIGITATKEVKIVSLVGYYSDGGPALTINQNAT